MDYPLLAFPHLSTSAKVLRPEDRNDQATIALDVYEVLENESTTALSWQPAAMWYGYEGALLYWIGELCRQMPHDSPLGIRWRTAWVRAYRNGKLAIGSLPWWLGDTFFHLGCQAQLISDNPEAYARYFVHAPLDLVYKWPTEREQEWQWDL